MTVAQLVERLRTLPQDLPACFVDAQMGGVEASSAQVGEAYVCGKLAQAVLIVPEDRNRKESGVRG